MQSLIKTYNLHNKTMKSNFAMKPKLALNYQNHFAELPSQFYQSLTAQANGAHPKLVHYNADGLDLLGINKDSHCLNELLEMEFGFVKTHKKQAPLAMAYSGHQFGIWAGQLGDGRAALLGQVKHLGKSWDIHLKGSGRTPYSRAGDGKAVMRSSIREYLASEHMHALGIPTSRSVCLFYTKQQVYREFGVEPGAMMIRLAESFIRFGHFEHFSYTKDIDNLEILTNYVMKNYFGQYSNYADWLQEVVKRTAHLMANWQAYGFCHGVMNTDNMSITGLTIDYGPYGFMEEFQPSYICNHSDHAGRYAFNQQPRVALWNLQALAYALQPLIQKSASEEILNSYAEIFNQAFTLKMCQKIGFTEETSDVTSCWQNLLEIMAKQQVDFSLCFRYLGDSLESSSRWLGLFGESKEAKQWLQEYQNLLKSTLSSESYSNRMNTENPKFILRNWVAEYIIREVSQKNDFSTFDRLLTILKSPFAEHKNQPDMQKFSERAPKDLQKLIVSCSS